MTDESNPSLTVSARRVIVAVLVGAAGSGLAGLYSLNLLLGAALTLALLLGLATLILLPVARERLLNLLLKEYDAELRQAVRPQVEATERDRLRRTTGITEIFDGFTAAEPTLLQGMAASRHIDIFSQIGSTVSRNEDLYNLLETVRIRQDAVVRVLKAGIDNPYLSESVALDRGKDHKVWVDDINTGDNKLRTLQAQASDEQTFSFRHHKEGYLWRYFVLDNSVYAQPYLFRSDNSERAPVYKLARHGTGEGVSLYGVFAAHFEQKWNENRPKEVDLDDELVLAQERVVAAVVQQEIQSPGGATVVGRVFVIPSRYLTLPVEGGQTVAEPPKYYGFHCPGGKLVEGEDLVDALRRELKEELGLREHEDFDFRSADTTLFVRDGFNEGRSKVVDHTLRPYCVMKRTERNQIIVAYIVDLARTTAIHPSSELGVAILMTPGCLRHSLTGSVTIRQLQRDRPNRVFNKKDERFFPDVPLRPQGAALIVASEI